ncbi:MULTISPECIES: hypothetical protein [unclassified Microcoleus]
MNCSFPHSIAKPNTSKLPGGDRSLIRCVSEALEEDRSLSF